LSYSGTSADRFLSHLFLALLRETRAVKISLSLHDCVRLAGRGQVCRSAVCVCVCVCVCVWGASTAPPHPPTALTLVPVSGCSVVLQEHKSCCPAACVLPSYGAIRRDATGPAPCISFMQPNSSGFLLFGCSRLQALVL
jgi:hypothetical protein